MDSNGSVVSASTSTRCACGATPRWTLRRGVVEECNYIEDWISWRVEHITGPEYFLDSASFGPDSGPAYASVFFNGVDGRTTLEKLEGKVGPRIWRVGVRAPGEPAEYQDYESRDKATLGFRLACRDLLGEFGPRRVSRWRRARIAIRDGIHWACCRVMDLADALVSRPWPGDGEAKP